jgi:hypothetical protein
MNAVPRLLGLLFLLLAAVAPSRSAPDSSSSAPAPMEYKLLANYQQPFNDALQYHVSKGWTPVGGVSITVWNNDLYFAQLIGRPAKNGQ